MIQLSQYVSKSLILTLINFVIFSQFNLLAADASLSKANELLKSSPIIDGHNDLPWVIRTKFNRDVEGYDISVAAQYDTDIPRLRAGMVGGQFWSVYVPSSLSPLDAIRAQLEQIDIVHRLVRQYSDTFVLATSVDDINQAQQQLKIASMIGIEGGHTIVNSLGVLRSYYDLGVRYMTLTHFNNNDWADSATEPAVHNGLTEFGKEVVREMNRLGMIVDLSHVSPATMNDALDVAAAPVMFSHSSARALTDHVRNVPDQVLKRLLKNDGVVMVTFIPSFVNSKRKQWENGMISLTKDLKTEQEWETVNAQYRKDNGTAPLAYLSDVADHIEHVVKIAGYDHVGIGGDYYGQTGDDLVVGLEDVSKYPALIAELINRGWSDENLKKLTRNNILRVFKKVELIRDKLQQSQTPSLNYITQLDHKESK